MNVVYWSGTVRVLLRPVLGDFPAVDPGRPTRANGGGQPMPAGGTGCREFHRAVGVSAPARHGRWRIRSDERQRIHHGRAQVAGGGVLSPGHPRRTSDRDSQHVLNLHVNHVRSMSFLTGGRARIDADLRRWWHAAWAPDSDLNRGSGVISKHEHHRVWNDRRSGRRCRSSSDAGDASAGDRLDQQRAPGPSRAKGERSRPRVCEGVVLREPT